MSSLRAKIEALLFGLGRPMAYTELAAVLEVSADDIRNAAKEVMQGGIVLIDDGRTLELRASGDATALIEKVRKEEFTREVGRAGLEVLSAILYRSPLSRSEIDFIRGVNSSQTLRTLTMRGLVRRVPNPRDERSFLYEPTTEALAELGVTAVEELPEYTTLREQLQTLERAYRQKESSQQQL